MTMADFKCDVCGVGKAIGVASTMIPYSCAFCIECAERHAQPEIVFETIYDDGGTDFDNFVDGFVDNVVTHKDGKYQTYREWATWRKGQEINGHEVTI
jgi:hypothetical protein